MRPYWLIFLFRHTVVHLINLFLFPLVFIFCSHHLSSNSYANYFQSFSFKQWSFDVSSLRFLPVEILFDTSRLLDDVCFRYIWCNFRKLLISFRYGSFLCSFCRWLSNVTRFFYVWLDCFSAMCTAVRLSVSEKSLIQFLLPFISE